MAPEKEKTPEEPAFSDEELEDLEEAFDEGVEEKQDQDKDES